MGGIALGRLQVYVDSQAIWIGIHVTRNALFVCPLPMLVFRIRRRYAE